MKYYETTFEEYLNSIKSCNLHPEISYNNDKIDDFKNTIIYGPCGVGKYTQALNIISRFSKTSLKYDKKLFITNEKNEKKIKETRSDKIKNSNKNSDYVYRISDIHYEVDMSILGCNSKSLWHEIFSKIVDIVSIKPQKCGIILCKNMHYICNELLEVFYSYLFNSLHNSDIDIKFILITEHLGYIPENILNSFNLIRVKRPSKDTYMKSIIKNKSSIMLNSSYCNFDETQRKNMKNVLEKYGSSSLQNIKELNIFKRMDSIDRLPTDIFNIVVDNIIYKMIDPENITIQTLRNDLYDILIYNIDVSECICHILFYFIDNDLLFNEDISNIYKEIYTFLKYFNNNYRPIYHLESVIFLLINNYTKKRNR